MSDAAHRLPLPACGERVGVRGISRILSSWLVPLTRRASRVNLSPQAGRGRPSLWRRLCPSLVAASIAAIVTASAMAWWIVALGPAPVGQGLAFSTLVVDRDGNLLRPYATPEGRWRLPATRENVDPRLLALLLAYEDKRFRGHRGVDPLALGRALAQLIVNGRIVSGASTITMQVARLLEPRGERSLMAKLRQMVRAVEIERALSKDEILSLYLSLAPYGGNLEGVRAASLAYFGKEPRRLTLGEAAMLVGLPQSPEQRRPDRSTAAARNARDRVLDRVAAAGIVPFDEVERAKREPVPDGRRPMPMLAPHAADQAVAAAPARMLHRLTIEGPLQKTLEDLARARAGYFGRDRRGRQCKRRDPRPRRVGGLFRRTPRRSGRHDPGAALARIGAQAFHLRCRL